MIRTSSQSGNTLVACHFAVGTLPAWPLPVPALRRPPRRSPEALTRTASLPERDALRGDPPPLHASRSHSVLKEEWEEEQGNDEREEEGEERGEKEEGEQGEEEWVEEPEGGSGRYYSSPSSPEEQEVLRRTEGSGPRAHNSFLPSTGLEDEEGEGEGGDNLHRYSEDSSFLLQGNPSWERGRGPRGPRGCAPWDRHFPPSNTKMATPGPDWGAGREDRVSRWTGGLSGGALPLPPAPPGSPGGASSSSSSSSSDGVLVTFSTIYDRSNLPAAPRNPGSPSHRTRRPEEGDVFLNLQPVLQPVPSLPGGGAMPRGSPQGTCSSAGASPQGLTPTGGAGLSAGLATATNQKYYRLVTCELPSQSPSPVWTGLTGWQQGTGSTAHDAIGRLHTGEKEDPRGSPWARSEAWFDSGECCGVGACGSASQTDTALRRQKVHTNNQLHCLTDASQHRCGLWASGSVDRGRSSGTTAVQPLVSLDQSCSEEGQCSRAAPVVRYSKAQRPTSLPIQPFVLPPPSSPAGQQPGSPPLPRRHHSLLLPQAASSTCSTCSPSPECSSSYRPAWGLARAGGGGGGWGSQTSPGLTDSRPKPQSVEESVSPCTCGSAQCGAKPLQPQLTTPQNKPRLARAPSCRDVIYLTPDHAADGALTTQPSHHTFCLACSETPATPPHVSHAHRPCPLVSPAPPTSPEGVKQHHHHPPTPASTSHLSSLPPWLSWGGSGLQHQQDQEQDQEWCLSPDTPAYESLSLSHLQRRGVLRSVSLAVELIMGHFGSTRDPEVKVRLGKSSLSPTIGGLVLEHLCPAIQNLLEDGLRDHSLDPIVGQRHNHAWNVVEASTQTGLCTRVLRSLVSKVRRHPQLTSQCRRLRAFLMGLLNLRLLEFWLSHLQSQRDLVAAHYHSWAFLSVCGGRAWPLYQELLLVLQPLATMPFDLSLLLEQVCNPVAVCPGRGGVSSCLFPADGRAGRGCTGASPGLPAPGEGDLRWAKLFGAAGGSGNRQKLRSRRPSEWLQLDRSQLGVLALSVWPGRLL